MDKMIYIPFEDNKNIGGPSTFMRNLKNYLEENSLNFAKSIEQSEGIFFPIAYDLSELHRIKAQKKVIIQRLDGIFYEEEHTSEQLEFGEVMKKIYKELASFVIFQSEYSKKQVFERFGKKQSDLYEIIINGVDNKIFFPKKATPIELNDKIIFISTGNFRNKHMLEPLINALDNISSDKQFELRLVGPIKDDFKELVQRDYVKLMGPKEPEELAQQLREADIFLFSFLNPACPNSVIEAIATGLPVVSFDSGAMKELLFFSPELLAFVSDKTFQTYSEFEPSRLTEKIESCILNYPYYKKKALEHTSIYSFDACGEQYIKAFEKAMKNNAKHTIIERLVKLIKK